MILNRKHHVPRLVADEVLRIGISPSSVEQELEQEQEQAMIMKAVV